ncbi:hypothetical protein BRD03_09845 [Halobacteriales archaeon QS_9_68_17]|nr:MAG: hypothetical protein BRD03_09845 [Halobacteriales archaeon QS_9_68_17]
MVGKTTVLYTKDGGVRLAGEFETRGFVPTDRIPGGPTEYLREVGTYLDGIAADAEPVYADDDSQWERVADYARSLASSVPIPGSLTGRTGPGRGSARTTAETTPRLPRGGISATPRDDGW